jgi:hypothetical protein
MATTSTFYVSTKDNKVRPTQSNCREYFRPDGDHYGKAKYIIEVFGYNHKKTAKKFRDVLDSSGLSTEIFSIKIEEK